MTAAPQILALDFDGVLCEGSREYFETSRRTYVRAWPDGGSPTEQLFPRFRDLRPVIESGWEMPLLVRALVLGRPEAAIAGAWAATRDALVAEDGSADLVARIRRTLDDVRREWIAADTAGWLAHHGLYSEVKDLRRMVAEPERTVIVTTKEGEFARKLLEHWEIAVADIQGKEAGNHKCENLRSLIAAHEARGAGRPRLWFGEDRLETLRCVSTHDDLRDVGLFLAAWGYNTPATRASVRDDPRIRLLPLDRFTRGLATWSA